MAVKQKKGSVTIKVGFVVEAEKDAMATAFEAAKSAIIDGVKTPKRVKVENAKVFLD